MNAENESATTSKYNSHSGKTYSFNNNMFETLSSLGKTPKERKINKARVGMYVDNKRIEKVYPFMVRLSDNSYMTLGELVERKIEPVYFDDSVNMEEVLKSDHTEVCDKNRRW